jgi:hypothetical protein
MPNMVVAGLTDCRVGLTGKYAGTVVMNLFPYIWIRHFVRMF